MRVAALARSLQLCDAKIINYCVVSSATGYRCVGATLYEIEVRTCERVTLVPQPIAF